MKYLFKATFKDGTTFIQDESDKHPTKETLSQFAYFLEQEKEHGSATSFGLVGEGGEYTVDLTTGNFDMNGNIVEPTEPFDAGTSRVIYFRNHTINYAGLTELDHNIVFEFGWQCTICAIDGTNHKHTLTVE